MQKIFTLLLSSLFFSLASLGPGAYQAQAEIVGPFEQSLVKYVEDGVLDAPEYQYLYTLSRQRLEGRDQVLAKHFMNFVTPHKGFIQISYGFYRGQNKVTLQFAFAPTYSENMLLSGRTFREVLGKVSQNDTLSETTADSYRCGAASLLAAHFLLYGNFEKAFYSLNMAGSPLTYRNLHLAQERLYHYANTDKQPGLVSVLRYAYFSDGRVKDPVAEGEVVRGAQLMGLKAHALIGPSKSRIHDRSEAVIQFWKQYPRAPILVGVYLNTKTGDVRPPDSSHQQNHFVVVFQENQRYWMVNSGVLDNGTDAALRALSLQEMKSYVLQTKGTLLALSKS